MLEKQLLKLSPEFREVLFDFGDVVSELTHLFLQPSEPIGLIGARRRTRAMLCRRNSILYLT